jgi:hypothetical protein
MIQELPKDAPKVYQSAHLQVQINKRFAGRSEGA